MVARARVEDRSITCDIVTVLQDQRAARSELKGTWYQTGPGYHVPFSKKERGTWWGGRLAW